VARKISSRKVDFLLNKMTFYIQVSLINEKLRNGICINVNFIMQHKKSIIALNVINYVYYDP